MSWVQQQGDRIRGQVFIGRRITPAGFIGIPGATMTPSMRVTESSPLLQDNPSHVEQPGVCPGSLPPALGRSGEPGAELLLQGASSLEHRGSRPDAELQRLSHRGRPSPSQLILLHYAGVQVRQPFRGLGLLQGKAVKDTGTYN